MTTPGTYAAPLAGDDLESVTGGAAAIFIPCWQLWSRCTPFPIRIPIPYLPEIPQV